MRFFTLKCYFKCVKTSVINFFSFFIKKPNNYGSVNFILLLVHFTTKIKNCIF